MPAAYWSLGSCPCSCLAFHMCVCRHRLPQRNIWGLHRVWPTKTKTKTKTRIVLSRRQVHMFSLRLPEGDEAEAVGRRPGSPWGGHCLHLVSGCSSDIPLPSLSVSHHNYRASAIEERQSDTVCAVARIEDSVSATVSAENCALLTIFVLLYC